MKYTTIILSYQIMIPFVGLGSLDTCKTLIWKTFQHKSPGHFNWQKVLGTGVLAILYRKQKRYDKNRQCYFSFLKNSLTGPGTYLLPFLPGFDLCLLLLLVLTTLAWCHSLLEFNNSPLWLVMYVPSSTSLVKGFWYAFRISLQSIQRTLSHHLCRHGCSEGACRMAILI